jgi:hypothetical protein
MRRLSAMRITLALLLFLSCSVGCKPKSTMPVPLPVAELPAALEKAFVAAPAEAKDLSGQVVASVRAQDYAKAHPQLQALAAQPKLNREQLDVAARGLLTLNELLQAAQAQGDQKAAETLQNYRINK